jgi:transcriptional regulator
MYIPHYFKNTNTKEVSDFIRQNGFAILTNAANGRPVAAHIPLELSEDGSRLLGHVSRANNQWKGFETNNEVLAIFMGPHAYVSASWYNHENVPTWNYIAVHVYGKVRIIEGQELYDSLKHLLDKYEHRSEQPVSMEKMSTPFLKNQLNGLVGFEIAITETQASYKLSQNRDDESYRNIIKQLEKKPDHYSHQVADAMKTNRPLPDNQ